MSTTPAMSALAERLEDFRKRHWMHWADQRDNVLICEVIGHIEAALTPTQDAPVLPGVPAGLFEALEHGDETHRAWLKEAIACFFSGLPVPAATPPTQELEDVFKAIATNGETCHFGTERGAEIWAGAGGRVERVRLRNLTLAAPPVPPAAEVASETLAHIDSLAKSWVMALNHNSPIRECEAAHKAWLDAVRAALATQGTAGRVEAVPEGVLDAIRRAGLTLLKTAKGYELRKFGSISVQADGKTGGEGG